MHHVSLKSKAASFVRRWTGALARQERRAVGATILMYHGVESRITDALVQRHCIDSTTLSKHLRFMRRYLKPLSLSELRSAIENDDAIDPRWVILTFDDALKGQVTVGASVLADARVPWSLSVPTGMVGSNRPLWTNELAVLILHCWRDQRIPHPLQQSEWLRSGTRNEKVAALSTIKRLLFQSCAHAQRAAYLDRLLEKVGGIEVACSCSLYRSSALAGWNDLRKVVDEGVEILCHGHFHSPHNEHMDDNDLKVEVELSRQLLQDRLGVDSHGFALPHGVCSARTESALRAAGYEFCLTSERGRVSKGTCRWTLPRCNAEYPLSILRRHMLAPVGR